MKIHSAFFNTASGRISALEYIHVKTSGNLSAVSVEYTVDSALDKLYALEIYLEPEQNTDYTTIERHSHFWCKPVFENDVSKLPEHIQCLLWKGGCILPVCDRQYYSFVSGTPEGLIRIYTGSLCSDMTSCISLTFVYGTGDRAHTLIEDCVKYAKTTMGCSTPLRDERKYPELFEYLGWCSWDAFMTDVSEDRLLSKIEEFEQKGIPVRWAIIDDMWADCPGLEKGSGKPLRERAPIMHSCPINSFKADSKRFPNGLSGCIEKIHAHGLKVGMWHPTTGYWNGITPDGEIAKEMPQALFTAKEYSPKDDTYSTKTRLIHAPDYESAHTFYDSFHKYLKDCGADFIKVDNQSATHRYYHNTLPIGTVAHNLHRAIDGSAKKYFDGTIINCMGTSIENMWNRPESCVSRCSDDFLPENPQWFSKHILQCSFNSLLQGVFHVCDWDMWWSDDTQAVKNSVLRAISGGPIYVSDTLYRSRKEILMPLCLSDGKILRCDRPAIPTSDCLFENPLNSGKPFSVYSNAGDTVYVAAFNLDENSAIVKGQFTPRALCEGGFESYVLYEYFSKSARVIKADEPVDIELSSNGDFKLISLNPVRDDVSFIGLTDKMISAKTIEVISKNECKVLDGGTLVFYSNKEVKEVLSDSEKIPFNKDGILYSVSVEKKATITVK